MGFESRNSISLIVKELFKLSISYWISCGSLYFFEELVHFVPVVTFMCVEFIVFPYYFFDV